MTQRNKNLSDALFPKVRQAVLGLLYNNPNRQFYTNEIIRLTDSGTGAVQRELEKLSSAGLIGVEIDGNKKLYQANLANPLFNELRSIILKTFGLSDIIREAVKPLENKISFAFIYGSIAKHKDTATSDIDLLIIGEHLTYADVYPLLEPAQEKLGRNINPTFYTESVWIKKIKDKNHFVTQVAKLPKIIIIGNENELGQFGKSSQNKSH